MIIEKKLVLIHRKLVFDCAVGSKLFCCNFILDFMLIIQSKQTCVVTILLILFIFLYVNEQSISQHTDLLQEEHDDIQGVSHIEQQYLYLSIFVLD